MAVWNSTSCILSSLFSVLEEFSTEPFHNLAVYQRWSYLTSAVTPCTCNLTFWGFRLCTWLQDVLCTGRIVSEIRTISPERIFGDVGLFKVYVSDDRIPLDFGLWAVSCWGISVQNFRYIDKKSATNMNLQLNFEPLSFSKGTVFLLDVNLETTFLYLY